MIKKDLNSIDTIPSYSVISAKKELFSHNFWTFEELGYSETDISSSRNGLNFERLEYPWLISLMKDTVWRKRNAVSTNTLISYVRNLCILTKFNKQYSEDFKLEDITYELMEDYFTSIQSKALGTQRTYFSGFNEIFTCWQEWGVISSDLKLLPRDMRPRKVKCLDPRALSPYVQQKLTLAVSPPKDFFDRMVLLFLEVGARGQEILNLRKNALHKDSQGWYLTRINSKFKKEITIPIDNAIAEIIQNQITSVEIYERDNDIIAENGFIFAHLWDGKYKRYSIRHINRMLKDLCKTHNILDELGRLAKVSTHNFRHTVGTNLINNGVSQLHVQKYLGHESSAMTNTYAHIHDSTLRKAILKSNDKMSDIRGRLYTSISVAEEIYSENVNEKNLDAQWLRKNIATQSLPNGVCALPIKTSCSHANACLTCPSFRSGPEHIKTHKEQKRRTIALIELANEKGYIRQAEINSTLLVNINNILEALDSGK
jgi:integrase/recombinase XerD